MAEKHIIVQGAICQCNFGTIPDKLKVLTNTKNFGNDQNGKQKPIASTLDIGPTFEKNMFGSCLKKNNTPCIAIVTQWSGCYEQSFLENGAKVLLEDSKATCPIGGTDCIKIIHHGQVAEPSLKNFENVDKDVQKNLNPIISPMDIIKPKNVNPGIIDG